MAFWAEYVIGTTMVSPNKGPSIIEGVRALVDVIVRMETHQSKKTPLLRALTSW